MRRPPPSALFRRAALAVLLTALSPALAPAQTRPTAAAPPAPPLSLENAAPLAVPATPQLKTPRTPAAPPPLLAPEAMAIPAPVEITPAAPVAAPVNPVGAPPPPAPRRAAAARPDVSRPVDPPPPGFLSPPPEQRIDAAAPAVPAATTAAPALPASFASLEFLAGASTLPPLAADLLAAVAEEMRNRPARRLQLRAYAAAGVDTERQARQLSLARAQAVREGLTALGVRSTRIDLRPLGTAAPPIDGVSRDRVDLEFTGD